MSRTDTAVRVISASPDRVFAALTDSDALTVWLAAAALAALRAEHPSVSWHTLGGHERDAVPFWTAAGQGVPGGYRQRDRCPHVTVG